MTGEFVALDLATGTVEWKHEFSTAMFGAPVAVNDLVFAATFEGAVYAFDGENGKEMWQTSLAADFNAGLVVSGDTLLAPAGQIKEGGTRAISVYRLLD